MQLQTQKVLAGSLNFVAPGDLLTEPDALILENWRADQVGALRSRNGHGAALFTGPRPIRSIATDGGSRRYFASGGKVYRGTSPIATGFEDAPIGLATLNGWSWAMNRGNQVKDDGGNTYAWTPPPPAAAPTQQAGSGSLNGDVSYWVTWDTEAFHESNPSPELALTGLVGDSATITRPTTPADPQVTHWNLYRQDTYLPQPYKVNTEPIPIATEIYEDDGAAPNHSSADLAGRGEALAFDHDPAPAARGCVTYLNRILAWSSAAHRARLWWSATDHPWYFPGSDDEQEGNWVDVGQDGEDLLAVVEYPRMVVLLKDSSIYRLVGDPDETWAEIERTNAEVGLMGEKAWARGAGGSMYLQGKEGIYRFNGDTAVKVSPKVDPIFKGDTAWLNGKPARPINPDPAVRALAVMEYVNGRLYFSYADDLSSTNNATLVYDEAGDRWYSDSRAFEALLNEGQDGLFLGARVRSVYQLESGTTDDATAIALTYQSGYSNQGALDNDKVYADLVVEHNTRGRTFTVYAYIDNGATVLTLGTVTSSSRTETPLSLTPVSFHDDEGLRGRDVSIRLFSDDEGAGPAEIYGIFLHYYLLPREGLTWDSGKITLDAHKVAQLDGLAFDVEIAASGSLAWKLWTDLPGEQFTIREQGSATEDATGTVRRFTFDFGRILEARWLRILLTSMSRFSVRGVLVHARAIGVCLDGDVYRTDQIVLRNGRLNLCKQVRAYCDSDAALEASFFTDVPSDRMTSRASGSMDTSAQTSGAVWRMLRLPSTTRARAAKIELRASGVARIYELQIRAKVLGEGPSAWQWVDVPVPRTPPGFEWIPVTQQGAL